jgi:hypothetical protein
MAAPLSLPKVTLCAATSVNFEATVAALCASMAQVSFGDVILFTDAAPASVPAGIRIVAISNLSSVRAYSNFILRELAPHIRTDHCLIVQWDGFVLDSKQWDPEFLDFDYIGAPWPQFGDSHNVGNGGFSLRSTRLLNLCRAADFAVSHPEDIAIGRANRARLERDHGIRFADRAIAERFAFERTAPAGPTFGFHGVFNLIPVLGEERFWNLYRTLDERSAVGSDYRLLMRQVAAGSRSLRRRVRLLSDGLCTVRQFGAL